MFEIKFCIIVTVLLSAVYSVYLFKHPGVLVSHSQLDYVKTKRSSGIWKAAYDKMMGSKYASLSFVAEPRKVVDCGAYNKPDHGCNNETDSATASYTHSLIWYYTGEETHANKSIEIMNAWSAVITNHTNHNAPLQTGWAGAVWAQAAEIIKNTNAGWSPNELKRFEDMLKNVYLPFVRKGASYANGNWELIMIAAMSGIAVFLDDQTTFDDAINMWRKRVDAYMYLESDGPLPHPPPGGDKNTKEKLIAYWYNQSTFVDGLAQETCRDLGHTAMGISAAINMAETAYHQGVDLYKEKQNRIVKAMEFHANYLNGAPIPNWLCGGELNLGNLAMWEIGYNHYHNRVKVDMPHTNQLILKKIRPSGSDGHLVAWETLTHAENPNN